MEGLWVLHGPSGRTEPYPFEVDARLISVQMLMMWSRQTILEIEIPVIEGYIEKMTKLDEQERDKDHETVLAYYQQQLASSKEEL